MQSKKCSVVFALSFSSARILVVAKGNYRRTYRSLLNSFDVKFGNDTGVRIAGCARKRGIGGQGRNSNLPVVWR
jgi:hypothetical protein